MSQFSKTQKKNDNNDCLFCNIVKSKIHAYVVYENKYCLAILDKFPISKGHCLIIGKKHRENFLLEDDFY